ncbi:hypothetical protein JR316_0012512, partial [Psilocybe cubensis]
ISPRPLKRVKSHDSVNDRMSYRTKKVHNEKEGDIHMEDESVVDDDYVHIEAPELTSKNRLRSGKGAKNVNRL